jgi:hypothetical protein
MPRIEISYRRDDSGGITGRIFDRLVAHYGGDSVFRDVDNIPLGADFREHINTVLAQTDVTLVVVGKRWFGPLPRRRRRIDDPADPVRVEVETALRNGMPVIPVLVEGGAMPNVDQLPDSLKEFVYRNGLEVDSGRDFDQHIERLIRNMEPILARRGTEMEEAARAGRAGEATGRGGAAGGGGDAAGRGGTACRGGDWASRGGAARRGREATNRGGTARRGREAAGRFDSAGKRREAAVGGEKNRPIRLACDALGLVRHRGRPVQPTDVAADRCRDPRRQAVIGAA